jgi:non-ribosomal peptide synthase protein (TIGR01720 family)
VLEVRFVWAPALLADTMAQAIADGFERALTALVQHAHQPGSGGHTPSDLPLVTLGQQEIDELEDLFRNL